MGIDIYMAWKMQKESEAKAQITGFDTRAGDRGYLREAYHGGPYATKLLLPESFADDADYDNPPQIAAAVLRARLPDVLLLVAGRERDIYKGSEEDVAAACKSFTDFVELAERKEAETGEPVRIRASY